MNSEMESIVICRHCGNPEYYGKMRWLNGRQECRSCYRHHYEEINRKKYAWDDLDGHIPMMAEYEKQEASE